MKHSRDIVAGVELAFFIPTALLAILVCTRHGIKRSSGWIYTLLLCCVRIAGAICQFLSHSNHSSGLLQATIVIDSIGLSPLLLATLGMLSRFVDFINSKSVPMFTMKHFRVIQLLVTIGLILSIAGGTSGNAQPNGTVSVGTTSRVGIILYMVAFAAMVFVYAASLSRSYAVPAKERRIPMAVLIALPFILVRLIYSACCVFLHSHLFNIFSGSVAVYVFMAVIEEFVVVALYVALGFFVEKLAPDSQGPIAGREWKNKKGRGRGRAASRGYSGGPQSANIEYGMPPAPPAQYHGVAR